MALLESNFWPSNDAKMSLQLDSFFFHCRMSMLLGAFMLSSFQVVLRLRQGDRPERGQHVRRVPSLSGRHHRDHTQAGHSPVLQVLRAVPQPADHVDRLPEGVARASHALSSQAQGSYPGQAGGRQLCVDRAALEEDLGQLGCPEGGVERGCVTAGLQRGVRRQ